MGRSRFASRVIYIYSETGAEVALLAAVLACIVVGVVTLKESHD
jgi:hypothetical protein